MRRSQLFTKTRKEVPSGEEARNAQLLIQAGFIHKEMAGVYSFLPLGQRVLEKIRAVVREEMNALGGQELLMSTLQNKAIWEQTNRWDDKKVDIWFKSKLRNGNEVGFGWSHEEPIGEMMKSHIASYKDLPVCVYQFQNKLRNEVRAKSGIMRGREFIMKDAYSFCVGEEDHTQIYDAMKVAYMKVFERLGIGKDTYITFADGGAFTDFSHEFQTLCEAGEDITYIHPDRHIAINEEVMSEKACEELGVKKDELQKRKTAEVGNIFNFGRAKAKDLGLTFKTKEGEARPVWMGSYGIGITRVMGVLVEKFADSRGLVWPPEIAPFRVQLVSIKADTEAGKLYEKLKEKGVEILYDDREEVSPGEKFADADLLGIPMRVVISEKTLKEGKVEMKMRTASEAELVSEEELMQKVGGKR